MYWHVFFPSTTFPPFLILSHLLIIYLIISSTVPSGQTMKHQTDSYIWPHHADILVRVWVCVRACVCCQSWCIDDLLPCIMTITLWSQIWHWTHDVNMLILDSSFFSGREKEKTKWVSSERCFNRKYEEHRRYFLKCQKGTAKPRDTTIHDKVVSRGVWGL